MVLIKLEEAFSVCKLSSIVGVNLMRPYTFLSVTDDEISLVCPTDAMPGKAVAVEQGWRALKVDGVLDFSLIGIVAKITGLLAEEQISVFVISTYNTDYILLKEDRFEQALAVLAESGYQIKE